MECFTVEPKNDDDDDDEQPLHKMLQIIKFYNKCSTPKTTRWLTFYGVHEDFSEVLRKAESNGLNPNRFSQKPLGGIKYDTSCYIWDKGDPWRVRMCKMMNEWVWKYDRICEIRINIGDAYGPDDLDMLTLAGRMIKEEFCNDFEKKNEKF